MAPPSGHLGRFVIRRHVCDVGRTSVHAGVDPQSGRGVRLHVLPLESGAARDDLARVLDVLRGLSHPIPALSFEYLPAAVEVAAQAAAAIAGLGHYRFNVTIGERRRFLWQEWRALAGLESWLAARRRDEHSGDVYARLES